MHGLKPHLIINEKKLFIPLYLFLQPHSVQDRFRLYIRDASMLNAWHLYHQNKNYKKTHLIHFTLIHSISKYGNIIAQNCSFHSFSCGTNNMGMESTEWVLAEAKEAREVLKGARS